MNVGIRHPPFRRQAEKTAKAVTVPDLKLRLVICKFVEILSYQHLEHQHRIKWRPTTLARIALLVEAFE